MDNKEVNKLAGKVLGWEPEICNGCDLLKYQDIDFIETCGSISNHVAHEVCPDWSNDAIFMKALNTLHDHKYLVCLVNTIQGKFPWVATIEKSGKSFIRGYGIDLTPHMALGQAVIELGELLTF